MTATIHRKVPPQRLITAMNPLVRVALRSPLHRLLDDAALILHVIGRKTGHHYDIPVGFTDLDGRLVVVTQHRWRRNLRGGVVLDVTRFGRRQRMHADLVADPASVADVVERALRRYGPADVEHRMGIVMDAAGPSTASELVDAVREFDLAVVLLTPAPESGN
ncbi:MAG TPA: hypothetical protein VIU11_10490 [Nakamurella sp.]